MYRLKQKVTLCSRYNIKYSLSASIMMTTGSLRTTSCVKPFVAMTTSNGNLRSKDVTRKLQEHKRTLEDRLTDEVYSHCVQSADDSDALTQNVQYNYFSILFSVISRLYGFSSRNLRHNVQRVSMRLLSASLGRHAAVPLLVVKNRAS